MTTTAPPLTGQDINLAARATRLLLVSGLDAIDTSFEDWVVINLVATGQVAGATELNERLSSGLGLDDAGVDTLLDRLVAAHLVSRDGDGLALTADGQRRWHQGQAIVGELVGWLYSGIDADELATTRRVLVEVTERAQERLRSRQS
jgi:hypothetical protein